MQYVSQKATSLIRLANKQKKQSPPVTQSRQKGSKYLLLLQTASLEDHEAIKCGAQALKKLCRIKTNMSWKEWRATMEAQKGASLQVQCQDLLCKSPY